MLLIYKISLTTTISYKKQLIFVIEMKYLIIAILISIPCYYYFVVISHGDYERGLYEYQYRNRVMLGTEENNNTMGTAPVDGRVAQPYTNPYEMTNPYGTTKLAPQTPTFNKLNSSLTAPGASSDQQRQAAASAAFSYEVTPPAKN
ncbi:MAG: hypothetical protein WCG87_04920 [Bacteroidota bacterium]